MNEIVLREILSKREKVGTFRSVKTYDVSPGGDLLDLVSDKIKVDSISNAPLT